MSKITKLILAVVLLLAMSSVSLAATYPAAVDKWLKDNQIGIYQEKVTDYKALYEQAKKEGKLVVYSGSSRMPAVAKAFETWCKPRRQGAKRPCYMTRTTCSPGSHPT